MTVTLISLLPPTLQQPCSSDIGNRETLQLALPAQSTTRETTINVMLYIM